MFSPTRTPPKSISLATQIAVSTVAAEAGIRFSVFITGTVYDAYVSISPGIQRQDEARRLFDIVWMLRFAIRTAHPGKARLPMALYIRNDNRTARLVKLVASCVPLDLDDPQPARTVMLPDQD